VTDTDLSQAEADLLIAMEKHRLNDDRYVFPFTGSMTVPIQSADRREQFLLDINRGRIDLKKATLQERGRQVIVLVRLDIAGPAHRNPDDTDVPCPHLHIYREGYGDKWAVPAPPETFPETDDLFETLRDFLKYCRVTKPPIFDRGLLA
jgi:hypothetical protein